MNDLREKAKLFSHKLQKIKVLAFDVDGILTDGSVHYDGQEIGWSRSFNTRDGYMMQELMRRGHKVGVMTGGNSRSIYERFGDRNKGLNLDFIFADSENKLASYAKIKDMGFRDDEILYMGDEFFDLPVLEKCGFSATVPEASLEILEAVDHVTSKPAGRGAAREVMDIFRYANGIFLKP